MNLRPARISAAVLIGLVATLAAPPIAGSAPIEDLQAQAKAIQGEIDANGSKIAALSEQLNAAQIKVNNAEDKIADADARTKSAEDQTNKLRLLLSQRAADLYKAAGGSGPFDSIDAGDTNEIASQRKYSEIASGKDDAIIGLLAEAKQDLAGERAAAEAARQEASTQRDSLKSSKAELDAANAKQTQILNGVNGEIATILEQQRQAQLQKEREALAAAQANPQAANTAALAGAPKGVATKSGPKYDGPPPSVSGGAGAAVAYAQAQVGKPYCYAGTGPDCYDCSGLTMMAWRQGGHLPPPLLRLPGRIRSARAAERSCSPATSSPRAAGAQHVGIWVGGGYVHATHTGDFVRYVPGLGSVNDAVRPGLTGSVRSGDHQHPELGLELLTRLGAERLALEPAVPEQPDHRDALHLELLRERGLLVDVHLDDLVGALAHHRRSARRSVTPARHGPHHGAQKSTITGTSLRSTSASKVAVVTAFTGPSGGGSGTGSRRALPRQHGVEPARAPPGRSRARPGAPSGTRCRRAGTPAPRAARASSRLRSTGISGSWVPC